MKNTGIRRGGIIISAIILLGVNFLIQLIAVLEKCSNRGDFNNEIEAVEDDYSYTSRNLFSDLNLVQCPFIFTKKEGLIGCIAKNPTITGILYIIIDDNDLKELVENDKYNEKYAVVTSVKHTGREDLQYLLGSGKVITLILSNCEKCGMIIPEHWSPASKSPNFKFGLYRNNKDVKPYEWNSNGVEVVYKKYAIPISIENVENDSSSDNEYGVDSKLIKAALDNRKRGYKNYPLNAVMVKTKFYGLPYDRNCFRDDILAKDLCTPFGGQSVWSSYLDEMSRNDGRPLIFILGKIDTSGFVNKSNFGSEVFKTSMLSLMAIAKYMVHFKRHNYLDDSAFRKNIIFSFFDAEFFGFSGSKRFVQDVIRNSVCESTTPSNNCPIKDAECTRPCFIHFRFREINFDNIEYILELDQISMLYENLDNKKTSEVFMHIPQYDNNTLNLVYRYMGPTKVIDNDYTRGSRTTLELLDFKLAFESKEESPGIPPSGAMSFLERKAIPTIVFTGYQKEFNNPYYYSFLDQKHTWSTNHLLRMCTIVEILAKSIIYDALQPELVEKVVYPKIDCQEIDELFKCFTNNIKCLAIKRVFPEVDNIEHNSSRNGAFRYNKANPIPFIVSRIMTNILTLDVGKKCIDSKECDSDFICSGYEIDKNGDTGYGDCYKVAAYYHPSYSPGLEYDYNRNAFVVTDESLGTWATVLNVDVRSYLVKVSSRYYKFIQLQIGIAGVLGTIALLVLFGRKRKAIENSLIQKSSLHRLHREVQ